MATTTTIPGWTIDRCLWRYWLTTSDSATTSTATDDQVWGTWTSTSTTTTSTSTSTSDTVWFTWNVKADEPVKQKIDPAEFERQQERLAAERRERTERRRREAAERLRKAEELDHRREAAEAKAKQLLMDLIGEKELKVYEETGRLFVKGRENDYIVIKGGFVKQIQKDVVQDLCVHLAERHAYPETDNVVALKLAIESDEAAVVKLANRHGSRPRTEEPALQRAACM